MRTFINILFICCLSVTLQGCETFGDLFSSSDKDKNDQYIGWDVEKFRTEAQKEMESGAYTKAVEIYEALESRYPFGESSPQIQLDTAYAYFKNDDAESALAAIDRFLKLNPRDSHVDYAYYLRGLVNYNRGFTFIDRYLPTDTSQRDSSGSMAAYTSFEELIRRFPKSQYAADSWQRMISLKNNVAMHEVHVARYYLKRKAYIAAANRAAEVVEKYQRTPAVPYALQVLQEAYTKLGMKDLLKDVNRVYEMNYPNGPPVVEQKNATFSHQVWDFIGLEK